MLLSPPLLSKEVKLPVAFKFREAVEADIAAMSVIRLAVTENRLSDPARITRAMYVAYIDNVDNPDSPANLGKSWVCELDGVIKGFASADKVDGSVWALFVSPEHEGRGLARPLLAAAAAWLFELGHPRVTLSTGGALSTC